MTVIEMSAVTKEYGAVHALDGVDLTVERGEIVALLGPNGAGKTTTFELLLDLVAADPRSGRGRSAGRRRPPAGGSGRCCSRPGSRSRSRSGSWSGSSAGPTPGPSRSTTCWSGSTSPAAPRGPSRRCPAASASGCCSRLALIGEPELLLLDEPTAAMDVVSRRSFWAQARTAVGHGATILFATHDMTEAETVADRILVIARGRLLADGSPAELVGGDDLEDVFLALTEEISAAHPEGAVR